MFMTFTIVLIIVVIVFNTFSGGGSPRVLRELFYGKYYAEDGIIDNEDKPNSRAAFQKCIDNNIGIKTEIFLTKDRKLALSTYNDLSKEYSTEGKISEMDSEEIEKLDILMFQDLLDMVGGKVPVIAELKVCDDNEVLCRRTADTILSYPYQNVAVASFHAGMITWFKRNAKTIFRGSISAPAKDFTSLPKVDRFMTGNLANNSVSRPQFILYRNKPLSLLVKFAFNLGTVRGIWTLTDKEEAKALQSEKEMIICRGFMPEETHYKIMPEREKSQVELDIEKKDAEKRARAKAKREYRRQRDAEKNKKENTPSILAECAEDFDEFNKPSDETSENTEE